MDPLIYYRLYPELRSRSWQRQSAHTRLMDYLIRKANPAQSQICGIDFPPGTILISSGQYCEQTGEHPQLFAYALRDLQYEDDIAVTLIGHNLIVTLTHYPAPAPEETPSPQPPSPTATISSSSAACTAKINIQHSKFHIQKKSPPHLHSKNPHSKFKIQKEPPPRFRSKNQHSKFNIQNSTLRPSPGALPP